MDNLDDDDDDGIDPSLNAISEAVSAAIEVHREFGPGHDESAYQKAMEIELSLRGIAFVAQCPMELLYKGHVVGRGRLDLLVENAVIVEIKSVQELGRVHALQVLSYLRITRFRLGLLINFNVSQLVKGVQRIAK
jgi:GxxExxY protein